MTAQDDRVVVEFEWIGTVAIPVGSIPAGGDMKAHIVTVLVIRDAKIVEQRHYDCYEPF
jgi:hypothetical protein